MTSHTLPAGRGRGRSAFERRAAVAWIRAADAGLIDADELGWLLDGLHGGQPVPTTGIHVERGKFADREDRPHDHT
ncbi:hypothetical protein [Amycolatopsis anabasis]|uniref:hypothetical protein n=1 Tax=Amycolatopsis anabasis TaxID=1840409 RepID=UPI00131E124C|nr:hypothetical protein [Amycolatopsis anabasis]